MNRRQLEKLGVPPHCVKQAIHAIQVQTQDPSWKNRQVRQQLQSILDDPNGFAEDVVWGELAQALIEDRSFVPPEPVTYRTWGAEGIEPESHAQMRQACSVPAATAAALMPDAHVGYGLPIGGVLACENAVIP